MLFWISVYQKVQQIILCQISPTCALLQSILEDIYTDRHLLYVLPKVRHSVQFSILVDISNGIQTAINKILHVILKLKFGI